MWLQGRVKYPALPRKRCYNIAPRISDEERLERIQRVFKDPEEARSILEYDKMVEGDKTETLEHDLSPEQKKIAQQNCHAGIRKPTAYKFTQRQRKENATKSGIITELAHFLEDISDFSTENVKILNKERQISFSINGQDYELTLVQKRQKK